jgi:hypothetical protein
VVAASSGKEILDMENDKDDLKDIFRGKLENYAVDPPESVWEGILVSRKRKRRVFLYRITSAAALLLLFITIPFLYLNDSSDNSFLNPIETFVANDSESANKKNAEKVIFEDLSTSKTNQAERTLAYSNVSVDEKSKNKIKNKVEIQAVYEDLQSIEVNTDENVVTVPVNSDIAIAAEDETTENDNNIEKQILAQKLLEEQLSKQLAEFNDQFKNEKNSGQSLSFGLAFNSIPGGIVAGTDFSLAANKSNYGPDPFQSDVAYQTSFYEEIESTDVRPPLSIGFKVSYNFNKRFALESGIVYTELSTLSKTVEMNSQYSEFEQALYYIGIPFSAKYDFISQKKFNLYLLQSIIFEKGVQAVNRTFRYEEGKRVSTEKDYTTISGMQLSTLSAAGVNVNLYRRLSIYGESGVQFFYLNRTQPFNIRSAKTMWPVFQTGLRVNI